MNSFPSSTNLIAALPTSFGLFCRKFGQSVSCDRNFQYENDAAAGSTMQSDITTK